MAIENGDPQPITLGASFAITCGCSQLILLDYD